MSEKAKSQHFRRSPATIFILVLGAPGAGKGTLCKRLASDAELLTTCWPGESLQFHHVSVGDLLRRMKAQGKLAPEAAEKVEKQVLMDGREIVNAVRSTGVVGEILGGEGNVLVLDGIPRNMDQLHAFREVFGTPEMVISLECPRQVAMERYLGRLDAERPDGDLALFEKRCDKFERENPGIFEYYKAQCDGLGIVIEVDVGSSNRSIDENYNVLKQSLIKVLHGNWNKQLKRTCTA